MSEDEEKELLRIDGQIKKLQAQIFSLQKQRTLVQNSADRNKKVGSAKETIIKSSDLEDSGANDKYALLNGDWE